MTPTLGITIPWRAFVSLADARQPKHESPSPDKLGDPTVDVDMPFIENPVGMKSCKISDFGFIKCWHMDRA
jgi:hypothetical protein